MQVEFHHFHILYCIKMRAYNKILTFARASLKFYLVFSSILGFHLLVPIQALTSQKPSLITCKVSFHESTKFSTSENCKD